MEKRGVELPLDCRWHPRNTIDDEHDDAGYAQCRLPRVTNDHLYQEKAKGNEEANDSDSRRDLERDFEDGGHINAPVTPLRISVGTSIHELGFCTAAT